MFTGALYPKTKEVLADLSSKPWLRNFYLAGGTALALQMGHRKSIDLDFFIPKFPKMPVLLSNIEVFKPRILEQSEGTLDVLIEEVKVSFLEYNYPLIKPLVDFNQVKMADILDIACMKITAISSRGSKKDFVDLYFIFKEHPFDEIWQLFKQKYQSFEYQDLAILKSLIYFEDADPQPPLDYLKEAKWEEVKDEFRNQVERLMQ